MSRHSRSILGATHHVYRPLTSPEEFFRVLIDEPYTSYFETSVSMICAAVREAKSAPFWYMLCPISLLVYDWVGVVLSFLLLP